MGNTINRRVLVLSALLVAALVLMSTMGLEDAQAAAKKVTLCHNAGQETQKTIKVSKQKAKKHLAHGDKRGKCKPLTSAAPAPAPPSCNLPPAYSGETGAMAWGANYAGQLGDGTTIDRHGQVPVKDLSAFQTVEAGDAHSLALKDDCTVWAWGINGRGQLGDGTSGTDRTTPVQVQNLSGVKAVAGGYLHTVALKNDGTVWAWGANTFGQLGDGTSGTDRTTPVQVKNLGGVKAIAAGSNHNLALKNDGTVWAWGTNNYGQLGNGTTTPIDHPNPTPVQVQDLNGVKDIGAGSGHSLALKTDGTVWAWGHNQSGELGDGTQTNRTTPVQVKGDEPPTNTQSSTSFLPWNYLSDVQAIDAGSGYSLALKTDGTVRAWGTNWAGQLGDGTTSYRTTPVKVQSLSGVKDIDAVDGSHTVALKTDGTVSAWGANESGQLGDGTTTDRTTPAQIRNLSDVLDIAAGGSHSLVKVSKPPVAQQ